MMAHEFLLKHVFFTTRQLAMHTGRPIETASRQLKRLETEGAIVRIRPGIWGQPSHPYYSPYGVVPYLLANEQGYISFLTALHVRGVISQIPQAVQVATTGHPRKLETSIGVFEFFQLQPKMFEEGVVLSEGHLVYSMATAEKALLDTLYLSTRKGNRFSSLSELDLHEIDPARFKQLLKTQVKFLPIRKHIDQKWASLKTR